MFVQSDAAIRSFHIVKDCPRTEREKLSVSRSVQSSSRSLRFCRDVAHVRLIWIISRRIKFEYDRLAMSDRNILFFFGTHPREKRLMINDWIDLLLRCFNQRKFEIILGGHVHLTYNQLEKYIQHEVFIAFVSFSRNLCEQFPLFKISTANWFFEELSKFLWTVLLFRRQFIFEFLWMSNLDANNE